MKRVCELMGNTSGYPRPQCNGLVEKFNSTIISMLSKIVEKHGWDWDQRLPYILFVYRFAVQDSTKFLPFYLLYVWHPQLPTATALGKPRTACQIDLDDYAEEVVANLSDAWRLAHDNIKTAQAKQKLWYDKKSVASHLSVGDNVMVHRPNQVQGKAWKFAHPYYGPYEVVTITPTNAEVRLCNHPNDPTSFVSLDRIRSCYPEMSNDVWVGHRKPAPCPSRPVVLKDDTTMTRVATPVSSTLDWQPGPVLVISDA